MPRKYQPLLCRPGSSEFTLPGLGCVGSHPVLRGLWPPDPDIQPDIRPAKPTGAIPERAIRGRASDGLAARAGDCPARRGDNGDVSA